ncbi:MAG: hypothetical protein QOH56_1098 [Pseudonocardiales bacterium]|jgi:hypothetical protein|nr:hypothetical protein [Pseudonocardiales bacterium]
MSAEDLDRRIKNALSAQANLVTEADLRQLEAPRSDNVVQRTAGTPWRWGAPLMAAAAVVALAVVTTLAVNSARSAHQAPVGHPSVTAPAPTRSTTSTTGPSAISAPPVTSAPVTSAPGSSAASLPPDTPTFELGYQPLWPFASYAEASVWQQAYRGNGSQPWHLDAGQTALAFTHGYLGFEEQDRVTSRAVEADGAHIGVGYLDPNRVVRTSAVLHLVRFGTAADSPWEVVGSDDTTFSLEQPGYGSTVSSPITVGGQITGVDEAIVITVRSLAAGIVGRTPSSIPAGGMDRPWQASVSFTGSGVLTVVASTGGHLKQVERFALQGVHT